VRVSQGGKRRSLSRGHVGRSTRNTRGRLARFQRLGRTEPVPPEHACTRECQRAHAFCYPAGISSSSRQLFRGAHRVPAVVFTEGEHAGRHGLHGHGLHEYGLHGARTLRITRNAGLEKRRTFDESSLAARARVRRCGRLGRDCLGRDCLGRDCLGRACFYLVRHGPRLVERSSIDELRASRAQRTLNFCLTQCQSPHPVSDSPGHPEQRGGPMDS
jgi:hypothetical protein